MNCLHTIAGSGDPTLREGFVTHVYCANKWMEHRAFVNSDGDFFIILQQARLIFRPSLVHCMCNLARSWLYKDARYSEFLLRDLPVGMFLRSGVLILSYRNLGLSELTASRMLEISFTLSVILRHKKGSLGAYL